MNIAIKLRHAPAAFASLACCAALGCVEPQEYADLRSEREIYIQKHLPETHLVLADLGHEIAQHEARLHDRAAKLSANGRSPESDEAYRRWNDLLQDMLSDRDELSRRADDVYFKYDELELSGSADADGQEDLAELLDDARSTAGKMRERLDTYRGKLSGASSEEIVSDALAPGIGVVVGDEVQTIFLQDGKFSSSSEKYASEDSGEKDASADDEREDFASPPESSDDTLVAAPEDEISRSWHDVSGEFGVSAVLRGVSAPYTSHMRVWLRRDSDGGTISVPYDSLSPEDRGYVDRRLGL